MPGDTKPHKAREAKKRHARLRKSGTIADMQRELWRAILCAKDVLLDASARLAAGWVLLQLAMARAARIYHRPRFQG